MKKKYLLLSVLCLCAHFVSVAQGNGKVKFGTQISSDTLTPSKAPLLTPQPNQAVVVDTLNSISEKSNKKDTIIALPFITAKKKAMYSAIVPGLGQIYNRQYWKLPLVYGALGYAGYQIFQKNDKYNYYRRIYAGRLSNKQEFIDMEANIPNDGIKYYQDAYRQDRDMAALLAVLGYGIQIMDALVFAHLKEFDISEDITMKFKPTIVPNYYAALPTMGVGMVIKFKK